MLYDFSRHKLIIATKIFAIFIILCITHDVSAQSFLFDMLGISEEKSNSKYKFEYVEGDKTAANEILLININGIIIDREELIDTPIQFRKNILSRINDDITAAVESKNIKGVLLEINSPGGEMTSCDILYNKLSKIRKENKPIIAHFKQLGASGAYYVACVANYILAHPTSLIGNIGVLLKTLNVEKLIQILGVKDVTIKSEKSPKKDFFSPFRSLTEDEYKMLNQITNELYDRFIEIVAKGRNKAKEEIIAIADGSVYTAKQALEKGLIDQIGYREDALDMFKKILKVNNVKLVKRKEKKSLFNILSDVVDSKSNFDLQFSLERFFELLMYWELPIIY